MVTVNTVFWDVAPWADISEESTVSVFGVEE
jgi:hypothetical protein